MTQNTPIPHYEALRFVSTLERKIKRKTNKLKTATPSLIHTDALTIACATYGFKNHYEFKKFCSTLRKRAAFFENENQRIQCGAHEQPIVGANYYLFHSKLELEAQEVTISEPYLSPSAFYCLMDIFVDWADEKKHSEFRVASYVSPEKTIHKYRELLKNTLYVVNDETDLCLWMLAWGGSALIKAELVVNQPFLSRWLVPYIVETNWGQNIHATEISTQT